MTIIFQRYNGSEWVTEPTSDGGGGASNHASLTNLSWLNSRHEGTAVKLAGFDASGEAAYYPVVELANPTAEVGLSAVVGTALTAMRSDAAPALDQGISPTWTAAHEFEEDVTVTKEFTASSGTGLAIDAVLNANPGSSSSAGYYALRSVLNQTSSNAITGGNFVGYLGGTNLGGTGLVNKAVAVRAQNYGLGVGGQATTQIGLEAACWGNVACTVGEQRMVAVTNPSSNWTITTLYGLYVASLTRGATNYAIYTGTGQVRFGDDVNTTAQYSVDGTQVVTNQQAAIADVATGGSATAAANATAINLILARLRTHGLIAT